MNLEELVHTWKILSLSCAGAFADSDDRGHDRNTYGGIPIAAITPLLL